MTPEMKPEGSGTVEVETDTEGSDPGSVVSGDGDRVRDKATDEGKETLQGWFKGVVDADDSDADVVLLYRLRNGTCRGG